MGEYTLITIAAVAAAVVFDVSIVRTRMIMRPTVWMSLAIMWTFQVLVDGWLTKLSSPIVLYNEDEFSGVRIFFDSPIEDFAYAFAMILLTLSVWERLGRKGVRP
jgi:lycopene cyclase domain-containing protein